jgi:hypothetical protein
MSVKSLTNSSDSANVESIGRVETTSSKSEISDAELDQLIEYALRDAEASLAGTPVALRLASDSGIAAPEEVSGLIH